MGIRHSHFGIRRLSGVGLGLAEAGDAVAVFPLAAFLEHFDALKALEDAIADGRLRGLARGLAYQLVENAGVLDRRKAAAPIHDLSPRERRELDAKIQARALEMVPIIPLGQYFPPAAHRNTISGILKGAMPVFWNVTKS